MIWNLIGTIGGRVLNIVDDVIEDKDAAHNRKFQIQKQLIDNEHRHQAYNARRYQRGKIKES